MVPLLFMYDAIVSLECDAWSYLTLLTVGPFGSYSSRFHDVSALVGTFPRGSFPESGFEVTRRPFVKEADVDQDLAMFSNSQTNNSGIFPL